MDAAELQALQEALAEAAFTEQVTVLRATRTPDGAGGFTRTWATVATYAAQVRRPSLKSWERLRHMEVQGTLREVWLAADADVQPGDRLDWDGRTWQALDVEPRRVQRVALVKEE